MVISTALQKQETGIKLSPLSFNQQRVWFLEQLVPKSPFYNLAAAYQLVGRLDVVRLSQNLNEIVRRHESLRTTFALVEEQPVQVIHPTLRLPLPVIELAELPEKERATTVSRLMTQEAQKPFELLQGPLLRSTLLCLGSHEHLLLLTMHHIISDESSLEVLIKELAALYQAVSVPGGAESPCPQPELPIQYADFALWQRKWLQSEVLESQLTYWSQQLDGIPTILELPTDRPRPPVQTWKGATYSFVLPTSLCESLKKLCQLSDVTLFMTLLAAFKLLLYRYSGQNEIVVGTPVTNRNRLEIEDLIGFFVNSLVLHTKLSSQMSFRELLAQVREVCLGAYTHQELPFEKLVEQLQPERDLSHNPLFQVMFTLHDAPLPPLRLSSDLTISHFPLSSGIVRLDLELHFWEISEGLKGQLKYNTELFDATTVMRMVGHFQTLLQAYVLNSGQRLSDLPLLTEPERQLLLIEWNKTQADYPSKLCIHQLFESQVARTPDAVAVVFAGHDKDHQLTYRELNQRANQLARYLQSLGVGPEVLVGICMERSLDMLIGLLGILKAGGTYVPLDPAYPKKRLAFILAEALVPVLLTQEKLVATRSVPKLRTQVICLDTEWNRIAKESMKNPVSEAISNQLAYVIYTSGSTGKPKGVQIHHRAVVNFLLAMQQQLGITAEDVLLAVTTIAFDIAVLELFLPLAVGAQVVIVTRQVAADGVQLATALATYGATVLQATPATWQLLLYTGWQGNPNLKILCGGEALPQQLATQLQDKGACLWNLYGPTESTIWSTSTQIKAANEVVTIGRPIANTQIYLLDSHLQPVPIGILGTLYIGGDGLARGYLNHPKLTAERFIPNPFGTKPGARMYKTGDLARYLPNGKLEFRGRIDHQVKIRGFRIELGEIETVLEQHPAIKESVVVVRKDNQDKQLVAYVVRDSHHKDSQERKATLPSSGQAWQEGQIYNNNSCKEKLNQRLVSEWRRFLQGKLPHYMVPTAFVLLDALPLTPNGKVNRRALPAPSQIKLELDETFVAPSTPVEELLAGIWLELLDLEQVGIYHNFFNLGGHSLTATQFISRVRDYLRVDISLRSLFESPTIAELTTIILKNRSERVEIEKKAQLFLSLSRLSDLEIERMLAEKKSLINYKMTHISKKLLNFSSQRRVLFEALLEEEGMGIVPQIPLRKEASPVTLSFAQQRLFFLEQLVPGSPFYNLPQAYHLVGPLDVVRLSQSLNEIVRRHESLRTTFAIVEEQPVQVIHPTLKLPLPVIEIGELPEKERSATVSRLMTQEAQKPFDLLQGPLLRSTLLRLDSHEHILLLTMHHIISDGWSLEVLIKELTALYQAVSVPGGAESPFSQPELPIQYADFALWQRKWLQGEVLESQLIYWTQQLDGIPTVFELPTARPRPAVQSFEGASYSFMLPAHQSQRLKRLCQQENVTLFMALLALFKVLLYRYSGQDDIVVGTPIANRNRAELEGLIGFFVNSLVLRTKLSSQMSFRELLAQVREVCLGAYAHQELPFEKLVEQLQPERDLSRNPLFQMAFALQNTPKQLCQLAPDLTMSPLEFESGIVRFDLELHLWEKPEGLSGQFKYQTDLFDKATVMRMADHLQVLLEGILVNPFERLSELPILTTAERQQLLVEWNETLSSYPNQKCIHELFEDQVKQTPNAVAVIMPTGHYKEQLLTYQQLNQRANQLAHDLQKLGVGPEVLVGICVERSLEMVVGILAILKAGGAYVPLDPTYPKERLRFMVEDSQMPLLLTQQQLIDRIPECNAKIVVLNANQVHMTLTRQMNPISGATASNLVYVIYTSGSTGTPKGVQIEHRGLLNLVFWHQREFAVSSVDRATQIAGTAFDASVWELWPYLAVGASVYLAPKDVYTSPTRVRDFLLEKKVTISFLPTPLAESVLLEDWPHDSALRILLTGGDKLHRYPSPSLPFEVMNNYGPTENTVVTTSGIVLSKEQTNIAPFIGRPIANTQVYILDQHLQPVPVGVPGELHISGESLARGYLNHTQLIAEKFIPNPFSGKPGARLYKSGDLARYQPDGNIEFLGRIDNQVKVRGFRIELGEIETVLAQLKAVREAIVVAGEKAPGQKYLVAYIVATAELVPMTAQLRSFLKAQLPNYMVPTAFIMLDKLPITPNGKVDRRALPLPDTIRSETTFVAPRTLTEKKLTDIWSQVLAIKEVGVYDNFFELGGHSLLATQIVSRVRDAFQIELPLHSLFSASSVADLAERIETFHWARPVSRDEGDSSNIAIGEHEEGVL